MRERRNGPELSYGPLTIDDNRHDRVLVRDITPHLPYNTALTCSIQLYTRFRPRYSISDRPWPEQAIRYITMSTNPEEIFTDLAFFFFLRLCVCFRTVGKQVERDHLGEIVGLYHILRHRGHARLMDVENSL